MMSDNAETGSFQAPEIFFAVRRMWEETFLFALEIGARTL
jgi:hypothetical protein